MCVCVCVCLCVFVLCICVVWAVCREKKCVFSDHLSSEDGGGDCV